MDFLKLLESGRTALLDGWFSLVTHLGEEALFMGVALVVLWCVDKRKGYYLLCVGLAGATLNTLLKMIYCIPRPWLRDQTLTIVESARAEATGYSFPSGHTQTAAGLYGGLARFTKNRMLRGCLCLLVLLVGFSRLYLGVHTPADVVASLFIGAALVFALYPAFAALPENPRPAAIVLGLAAFLSFAVVLYAELVPFPENAIFDCSADGVAMAYKTFGGLAGLFLAFWIDERYLGYQPYAPLPVQVVKCALGLAAVVAARALLKAPLLALFCGHPAAGCVRYLAMSLLAGAGWPAIFRFFPGTVEKSAARRI